MSFATRTFAQPYYRPLQVVTASALDAAFGREPRSFRAASLLLGAATASLLALLALGLLRSPGAAALCGAAFAADPRHREGRGAAEGDGFALGAARCALALGRAQEARSWLARIPPERASAGGLDAEIARLRASLAQLRD